MELEKSHGFVKFALAVFLAGGNTLNQNMYNGSHKNGPHAAGKDKQEWLVIAGVEFTKLEAHSFGIPVPPLEANLCSSDARSTFPHIALNQIN